jgi:hypothetical protein
MDPRTAVRRLLTVGKKLPPPVAKQIRTIGADAVPFLVELVDDRRLYEPSAQGHGWAPLHAMLLLGELQDLRALEPIFRVLSEADVEAAAFSRGLYAIVSFGVAALEPTLARYQAAGPDERTTCCEILAELQIKDERIWNALVESYDLDRPLGASHFQIYGDARALPILLARLDVSDDLLEIVTIDDAIKKLGGQLDRRQAARSRIAHEELIRRHAQDHQR